MSVYKSEHIANILSVIPETPGCYQYFDERGTIIYIGKAKNLKKRVHSYFNKESEYPKTRVLVKQIRDIKYIVVSSEEEALLLENNLIKQYRPRYNVMLKDDKTYPSIVIRNEYFSRVFTTRNIIKDGSQYFGPYTSAYTAKMLVSMLKDIYPLRICHLPLTPETIAQKKYKVCLQYHIKRCKGPCEGLQSLEDYQQNITEIREILKGNVTTISKLFYEQMQLYASELRFEEAQAMKEKYEILENYRTKSTVVTPTLTNIDVFSFAEQDNSAYINYLHIGDGAIVQAYTFEYKKKLDETPADLLALGIVEMRERFKSTAREIIVPFEPGIELEKVSFTIPQRGDKKKLLGLSEMNVKQYKVDRLKQAEKLNPEQRNTRLLKEIQESLHLEKLPARIECFDNSNIQGSDAVAACVVFIMGKPAKKEYRKYIIKTVEGPDDYASMKEVVRRRYSRALNEETPLPDLIITDGGKGQMEVVRSVIEDELELTIPIAGLAKDRKHRTSDLLFGTPPESMGLARQSPLFRLLEMMQNEVHRFAITFHKDKRSKGQTRSELDQVKGVGEKTKEALLRHFKSVKRIREAELEELTKVVGPAKAALIKEALS
ncbi:excinuclease ABC subunit C [Parabacteroides sp. PFB2-12]|uniref:excinuclease ABC subunit UvrC n=1 Tax=unclassified Parabacteroides TaxID=2649774 RepID=UPI0024765123|nr:MULTISPECIES: excinuclease ABC subunit UvrC [unclassified Parabacteroides]MDH6342971.1 excinuclease ABC subunit C [Parabacteroides sp. PM6-13]MDH6391014.1 excinuclease ABC subunit C [Parabacteroides sp. PFB2-12]